ncbi:hypothetical protein TNIN_322051 [Trichonephila inaurata madagascariensis]|uniref:Uncharacterized protein n=1 Tax=Trichonephila inaurata madagascariensis TaxID=2747483 RepID=A0A8X7C048_9ARAC|nr:hypothetical protein TNIN_322051 [Trichonephila inaurata madagascariensis]
MDFDNVAINRCNTEQSKLKCGRNWKLYPMEAYGSVHRGTDPRHRFQSRGYGQQHQSHMVRLWCRLCNRIDIIFARPEIMKISRGKGDN